MQLLSWMQMNHFLDVVWGDNVETPEENDPDKLPRGCQISEPYSSGVVSLVLSVVMSASLFP